MDHIFVGNPAVWPVEFIVNSRHPGDFPLFCDPPNSSRMTMIDPKPIIEQKPEKNIHKCCITIHDVQPCTYSTNFHISCIPFFRAFPWFPQWTRRGSPWPRRCPPLGGCWPCDGDPGQGMALGKIRNVAMYPLVNQQKAIENGPFIAGFPIRNGDFP